MCVRLITIAVREITVADTGSGASEVEAAESAPDERNDERDELELVRSIFVLDIDRHLKLPAYGVRLGK